MTITPRPKFLHDCRKKKIQKEVEMKAKIFDLVIYLIAVFLTLVFAPVYAEAADQVVKIGHLTDMTGPVSPELIPISRGTAIYFQDLNKKGGVNGIKLDLEWVDTKYQLA